MRFQGSHDQAKNEFFTVAGREGGPSDGREIGMSEPMSTFFLSKQKNESDIDNFAKSSFQFYYFL